MNEDFEPKIVRVIKIFVGVIVLLIWSIIGFILWIPLLIRMIAYFSSMIMVSAFTAVDIEEAQKRLNLAIEFYSSGFKKSLIVINDTSHGNVPLNNNTHIEWEVLLKDMAIDIVWAIIFWGSVFLSINYFIQ